MPRETGAFCWHLKKCKCLRPGASQLVPLSHGPTHLDKMPTIANTGLSLVGPTFVPTCPRPVPRCPGTWKPLRLRVLRRFPQAVPVFFKKLCHIVPQRRFSIFQRACGRLIKLPAGGFLHLSERRSMLRFAICRLCGICPQNTTPNHLRKRAVRTCWSGFAAARTCVILKSRCPADKRETKLYYTAY